MEVLSVVISICVCLGIVLSSLIKPSIKIKNFTLNLYWVIALMGALILLLSTCLPYKEFIDSLFSNSSINPLKILILFISMTMISIFLDELGFFAKIANKVLKHTKDSQIKIFVSFYFLVAILTMFTSNDIIILTLTPFIIFFCKNAKISPIPYLVSEFVAANTWSMIFVIGNPTNIYLAESYEIGFVEYFLKMAIPTLCAGIVEFLILLLLFRNKLKDPINHEIKNLPSLNRFLTIYGLSILGLCTVLLIISSYISLPMYLIAGVSLLSLVFGTVIYYAVKAKKPSELLKTFRRGPYELIPFVLSMFVIVLSLNKYGITQQFSNILGNNYTNITYGYSSLIVANLLNNIPMSVFYSSVMSGLSGSALNGAIYSSVIGSNIGAFLTPVGALAGIMWLGILKSHDIKYSFLDFIKNGILIALPVATISILMLSLFL